jgi:hypothetical protein
MNMPFAVRLGRFLSVVALLCFALTMVLAFESGRGDSLDPCGGIQNQARQDSLSDDRKLKPSQEVTTGSPKIIDYFPGKIGVGGPLCVVLRYTDDAATSPAKELHLFLDGLELKDSIGSVVERRPGLQLVRFDVARTSGNSDVWAKIIGQPGFGTVMANVGAGFAGEPQLPHEGYPALAIRIFTVPAVMSGLATFLIAVVALACFASVSAILRDGNANSTYSLGRVQMAVWFYLVTAAFLYLWLVTNNYNGIVTPQALTLLGISAATGLTAIALPRQPAPQASAGFLNDILSDNDGVSLHRLQMLAWTGVLAAVFLTEIYHGLRLPEFDTNLLILMGISGVTYVGFKSQEGGAKAKGDDGSKAKES